MIRRSSEGFSSWRRPEATPQRVDPARRLPGEGSLEDEANQIFADPDEWMHREHPMLGGRSPQECTLMPETSNGSLGSPAQYKIHRSDVNLTAVALLTDHPENRPWYRVVGTRYLGSAIATAHTVAVPSRFYDPTTAYPQFSSLYVSDNSLVAMFEAQALFGSPTTPGGSVPAPAGAWTVLTVRVQLDAVVDLSDMASQALLDASVQEALPVTGGGTDCGPLLPT